MGCPAEVPKRWAELPKAAYQVVSCTQFGADKTCPDVIAGSVDDYASTPGRYPEMDELLHETPTDQFGFAKQSDVQEFTRRRLPRPPQPAASQPSRDRGRVHHSQGLQRCLTSASAQLLRDRQLIDDHGGQQLHLGPAHG